jgi:long-chain acyl-CoA synthetase
MSDANGSKARPAGVRRPIDIKVYDEPKIAPRGVFDGLAERAHRPRFLVPAAPSGQGNQGWTAVTWQEFAEQIRDIALFLVEGGLRPGDRAAVFAPNSVSWAVSALAIQAAGGVMVPIYPASTPEQALYVLRHSDAKFCFCDATSKVPLGWNGESVGFDAFSWNRARSIGARRHGLNPALFEETMNAVSLDQPGMMLYTSGTSGNPKGVPLSHRNTAVNGHDWMVCNAPLLEENAVDILWLPMSHIFGLGELCIGNALGWTSYLADPASALGRLSEVRPTVFFSVPSHWEKLSVLSGGDPVKLRELTGGCLSFCLSGGAGLKRDVKELFYKADILIIEGYGLTECSPTLTLNRPGAFRFDSVGKPLPSVQLKLAEDGEIFAKGPNVFGGYHKDPDATREAFTEDGWFKTGDVGRFTEDGFLQIVDRKKDILVTAGGKNVPPANIELRFRDDPLILHLVVYGEGKKYLVAGVWPNDEMAAKQNLSREALRSAIEKRIEHANAELASFETIKRFRLMDKPLTVEGGLLTTSLKLRRKNVYATFREEFEALYETAAPVEARA